MILFLRPVFYLAGMMQLIVAALMMVPCLLEIFSSGPDAEAFLDSALLTGAVALALIFSTQGKIRTLSVRQMFMLVVMTWGLTCGTCALPYIITRLDLTVTDAVFESVSGLTTSGSTVVVGLDRLPGGILLWRSLTQWLGGIGIVGVALVLFPLMRIGGMQLFKSESSEKGEKIFAQARTFAASLLTAYLAISVITTLLFRLAGMDWFDAINHMMSAVSTGGFSNKDASLGYYQSDAVLWAATAGMILGSLPFTWYMLMGVSPRRAWQEQQVRTFLLVCAALSLMLTTWVAGSGQYSFWAALTHSVHNMVSIITTTGFVSTDYSLWGSFPTMLLIGAYFVGGCTGSTTGSIKIFRWSITAISLRQQILRMMLPHRVSRLIYNGRPFSEDIRDSVANFIVLYFVTWLISALVLSATGLDVMTSLTGALSALSNTGPGFAEIIGPAGNFSTLNDFAKWTLSFTMLLGRLEILVVIMVFMPSFWRD